MPRNRLKHLTPVRSEAAVEVAEVLPERDVLGDRQETVREVFVRRHATFQHLRAGADSRAQHDVADAEFDDLDGDWNDSTVILIVRVDHHHEVSAFFESRGVAGLLVPAVARVVFMLNDRQAKIARDGDGVVGAAVVNKNDFVDGAVRNIREGSLQGAGGVVRRHDGNRFQGLTHAFASRTICHLSHTVRHHKSMLGGPKTIADGVERCQVSTDDAGLS